MANSLLTYVKENPTETAINVATLIPAVGGVIKGGSLLYKAGKTLNKVYNKGLKEHKDFYFKMYVRNLLTINKKRKKKILTRDEAVSHKIFVGEYYKSHLPGGKYFKHHMETRPEYFKNTLLTTKKAQQGSGLIVGGIGTTAHLKGLQK